MLSVIVESNNAYLVFLSVNQDHDVETEQPATFWLERAEEVHVSKT